MSLKSKAEKTALTKKQIYEALNEKGVSISESTPFKEVPKLIMDNLEARPPMWNISEGGNKVELTRFPKTFIGNKSNSYPSEDIVIEEKFTVEGFTEAPLRIVADTIEKETSITSECFNRNSIVSFEHYQYFNYNESLEESVSVISNNIGSNKEGNPLGYFITGDNGEVIKWIKKYDPQFEYKPDQLPNFPLRYDPATNTMTIKAGTYESNPNTPKGESAITIEEDIELKEREVSEFLSGLAWRTWYSDDSSHYVFLGKPIMGLNVSTYLGGRPKANDYVRSQFIKTTSTGKPIGIYTKNKNIAFQEFTNDFVELNSALCGYDYSKYEKINFLKENRESQEALFNEIGDQYIFRTYVGDGFRNYISEDFNYHVVFDSYHRYPTPFSVHYEVTTLEGDTYTYTKESPNADREVLKQADYVDLIVTVTELQRDSYGEDNLILNFVSGDIAAPFSRPISVHTTYELMLNALAPGGVSAGCYLNVLPDGTIEDSTEEPRYKIK